MMNPRRASFHTLGCKLNFAETSTIGKHLVDRGFQLVPFGSPADICVINTCSVTETADRECRQVVRRALRTSPNPLVVVTGCYAQLRPEEVASIEGVDYVLGSTEKFNLFDFVGSLEKQLSPHVVVSEISSVDSFGVGYSSDASQRTRAFLKVQDGCDFNCTFCTIPLARGNSRSQAVEASLTQARLLVAEGYKEIVLTGVNVGDYGKKAGGDLLTLLKGLNSVDGLERIRISSIEPNLLSDDIIDFVAGSSKLCDHFHIPLQSGSPEILKRMRRRYTVQQYASLLERIRAALPDCGIGVDVIVGFPGETDEHFEETRGFLLDQELSYLHVFTYSERPDTPASLFEGKVRRNHRTKRNAILRSVSQKKRRAFCEKFLGSNLHVLTESEVENGLRFGFTRNYIRCGIPAEEARENEIVVVRPVNIRDERCIGEVVGEGVAT